MDREGIPAEAGQGDRTMADFTPTDETRAREMSAAEAISYHYDNDTRFFSLWLDPSLSYSSGRWHDALGGGEQQDLAGAQEEKLRFHLDASRIGPGGALVDIGCGWGAIVDRAVRRHGARRAVGLTLSHDQAAHVRATAAPEVEVILQDVFAWEPGETFDAAVSIGAFEHFARPDMSRDQKVATYRNFFERMGAMLRPGARFSLQTIVWDNMSFDEAKRWIPETVFPQSDIPFIDEVVAGSHGPFRLVYMENDPTHYAKTLDAWIANLRAQRETVLATWGPAKYEFFERYLRNSKLAFARRKNSLARFVLMRR
jgi:cyclopropane-fatty-acyl-phospholipid synthase